jgi:hypothetical protein
LCRFKKEAVGGKKKMNDGETMKGAKEIKEEARERGFL